MTTDRFALRNVHGLRFYKLLGTGSGETFSVRDADLHHWGLICAWDEESDARVFELGPVVTHWDRNSTEKARFLLDPVSSRGSWGGERPFEPAAERAPAGAVAAITRARVKPSLWRTFARATPPVADATQRAHGLRLKTGIGEAPIGLQGTFSVWENNAALLDFAYGAAHSEVISKTAQLGWYSEELFARFAVRQAQGAFCGASVDGASLL